MGLRNNIKIKMEEHHLSIAELERTAGLKTSAVRNLLSGKLKKPNAQTIKSIAAVFNCNPSDLLDENELVAPREQKIPLKFQNPKLFMQISEIVASMLEARKADVTLEQVQKIIKESYLYSVKKEPNEADIRFIEWWIDKIT